MNKLCSLYGYDIYKLSEDDCRDFPFYSFPAYCAFKPNYFDGNYRSLDVLNACCVRDNDSLVFEEPGFNALELVILWCRDHRLDGGNL